MSALAALVLAQVVTLGLRDRTEARRVVLTDKHYEAETVPGAQLQFHWPRFDLALNYGVSFLGLPIESSSRRLLIYQTVALDSAYRIRNTRLTFNSSTSFGERNFFGAALTVPNTPATTGTTGGMSQPGGVTTPGQPGTGPTVLQTRTVNRTVRYATSTNLLQLTHKPIRSLTLGGSAGYTVVGGLDDAARRDYPMIRSTALGVQATHLWQFSSRDTSSLNLTAQHVWSSADNQVTALLGTESWSHAFDEHTTSIGSAGISVTRFARVDGLVAYSIFPAFQAGVTHTRLLARGNFNLTTMAYSRPALDLVLATVDPRLGGSLGVGWQGKHFSTSATGDATFSLAPVETQSSAFDSIRGTFFMGYRFNDYVMLDAGLRIAKQTFQNTSIPFSYAIFAGVSLNYIETLHGRRR